MPRILKKIYDKRFGDCCNSLKESMTFSEMKQSSEAVPGSTFRISETNNLYLGVGFLSVEGNDHPAWFDEGVMYCPFCGTQLQKLEFTDDDQPAKDRKLDVTDRAQHEI